MRSRLSATSVVPQSHFIAFNDIKSKHFLNMLGDSRLCIISCIRQPVAQKLNKIHVLVYIRASFVDILREKVSYRTVSTRLRD